MTIQRPFSSGSRSAPDPYDNYLEQHGYYRKHTARDSSSLFRVVSEQMYDTQNYHLSIRAQCIQYMRENRSWFEKKVLEDFDEYLDAMSKPKTNGSLLELQAIAYMYERNVMLFNPMDLGYFWIFENCKNSFNIFVSSDSHFDTVYSATFIEDAGFCQSICYEILYKNVFKLPDVNYAAEQMLYGTSFKNVNIEEENDGLYCRRIHLDDGRDFEFDMPDNTKCVLENEKLCHFHNSNFLQFVENIKKNEESDSGHSYNKHEKSDALSPRKIFDSLLPEKYISCVRQLLAEGITPFPYKVAKALDPDMYRNIEFDSWSEIRKEHRAQNWYSGGNNLQVGVKCQVYLQETNEYLTGYIQEINGHDSNCAINETNCNGPCVVFIEQMGEKLVVPYDCLKPLPPDQIKPWVLPYRLQQKISNEFFLHTKPIKIHQNFDGNPNCKMIDYYSYDNFTPINQTYDILPVNRTICRNQLSKDPNKKKEKSNEDSNQFFIEQNNLSVDSSKNSEQQKSMPSTENVQNIEQQNSIASSTNIAFDQCAVYNFAETYDYNYSTPDNVIPAPIPGPHYYMYPSYQQPMYMQPPGRYFQTSAAMPVATVPTVTRIVTGSINYSSRKSVLENGDDLPSDISTLRYFYNMGVEHYNEIKSNPENNGHADSANKLAVEMEKVEIENDSNQNGMHMRQSKNNNSSNQNNYNCPQQQHQIKYRYHSRYYNNRKGQNNYRGGNNSGNYSRYSNPNHNNNPKSYLKIDTRNNRNNNTEGQQTQITPNSSTTENETVQTPQALNSDSQTNTTVSSTGYSHYNYDEPLNSNLQGGYSNPTPNGNLYMPQVIPLPFGATTLGPPPPLPSSISQHSSSGYQYITNPYTPGMPPHYVPPAAVPNQYYVPSAAPASEILGLVPDGIGNGPPVGADHGQYYPFYYSPNNQSNGQPTTAHQGYWYAAAPPPLLPSQPTGSQCMTPSSNTK